MYAPLIPVTIAFLIGIFMAGNRPWSVPALAAAAVSAVCLAWISQARSRQTAISWLVLWVFLGALRMAVWNAHPSHGLAGQLTGEPVPVALHGVITQEGVPVFNPHEEGRWAYVLAIRHKRNEASWQPVFGQVRLMVQQPRFPLKRGDEVLVEGRWLRPPSPGNPGAYDSRASLARRRIQGLLQVKAADGMVLLGRSAAAPLRQWVATLRRRCEAAIREVCEEPYAGLLISLLLGQRAELDDALHQAFVETGTIHLLVISGFNVGVIAWMLEIALRFMGVSWRLRPWLAALGLGLYGLFTGWQPPVARATVMAWMVLAAMAFDRVVSWPNLLAAAGLIIAGFEPTQLFDPSFQLSFGAVASLLIFVPRWQPSLEGLFPHKTPVGIKRVIGGSLCATAAVWVGLAPVLACYFHQVTPVSLLANVVLAPLVSLLVAVGTPLVLVSAALPEGMAQSLVLLRPLIDGVIFCVEKTSALAFGHWPVSAPSIAWCAGYYGLVAMALLRRRLLLSGLRVALCFMLFGAIWVWSAVVKNSETSRWLRVDVLDVGHGDSILIRTPGGHKLLVDAGSREAGEFRVASFLRHEGIGELDVLILTHTDEDHIGGAIPLFRELRIHRLLTNGVVDDTMSAHAVSRLARAEGIRPVALSKGQRLDLGRGIACEVLHPPRGFVPGVAAKSNDNGMVIKLTKGKVSFLLTADIEEAGLPYLLADSTLGTITVLKVPHHGSRLGETGQRFFEQTNPRVAIISVGSLHGLPAVETVEALARTEARLYTTRKQGVISLCTDGMRLEVCPFRSARCDTITVE